MRLNPDDAKFIRQTAQQLCGDGTAIRLFGSRLLDDATGGDVDLFLDLDQTPTTPRCWPPLWQTRYRGTCGAVRSTWSSPPPV